MSKYAIIYDKKLKEYDLSHVLKQDRYQNFINLFKQKFGQHPDFDIVSPSYATKNDLKLIHTEEYIRRIEKCESKDPHDTPLSPGLVRGTKLLAGAGKLAGEVVQSGKYEKAFVVGGGVQHATRNHEKGFGVFSDVGICAENLMRNFEVNRILIIDTDAHAGDGIYEIFSTDPRVLFISIHQDPLTLYPGKGFVDEIGEGRGKGYSVNIPMYPGSGDHTYEYVLNEILIPIAEEFMPEIILMVDGSDPHFTDRITQMGLTLNGIKSIGSIIGQLASKICEGKIVDFIGSGYSESQQIVSLGWLASIVGVTETQMKLEEPNLILQDINPDNGFEEVVKIVNKVKKILSYYWKCFS
jgi:acetoin utilization protein AcuC